MLERPVLKPPNRHGAAPALEVALCPGVSDEIDQIAAEADPAHAFLRAAWFEAAGGEASTLVARRPGGTLLAVLPLSPIPSSLGLGRFVPGCYWPCRSFPVALDARAGELQALLEDPAARAALGPVWRLGPVNEDDPTARRLLAPAEAAGWRVLRRELSRSYVLDIPHLRSAGAWPRRTTLRKNRWFEKELAKHGLLRFSFHSGADWTAELFDTLAEIERNSWLSDRTDCSGAKFLSPRHRAFWENAASDPALAARMRVALLHIGGVPAAFQFDLDCAPTSWAIANSFDRRFARYSPGRVLCYRNFETLEERGITRIDWGAGDPGYKRTMGAEAGAPIVDYLFVRSPAVAALARPFWR